ncbi:protein PSK SIMULATOR 1 [Juglans microcarpa x Juglans regia]|uniref:protein PSK SIMULATOR 1 n=1 Tax=Juglans microcarpa x Juglans regia TaxID=2249226 RepID=UPI001B7E8042|nr:protein PSK SIMULATOR 1 [Juglans microcarpa x Juglans regia]XP_040994687.1 protein PSK SIMULATOR 1 [Juglans microcarpa x Juglans regia]
MVAEPWFRSLWKTPRKHEAGPGKVLIGVLAFEVVSLMSKVIHLWQSLSDRQISRLREEITNSVGIKKLVSDNEDVIVALICAEMFENLGHVAKSVARLGAKCNDPSLKSFENAFSDSIKIGIDPYGWGFTWRKMENKVKKMERFIAANANLYQEMEILSDLELTLRRMKGNDEYDGVSLLEYQKKVSCKQQEVKNLQRISLWSRSYDYTVRLLAGSLMTISSRMKHVFGIQQMVDADIRDSREMNSDYMPRSHSVSALLQTSDYPSKNGLDKFASGPLGGFIAKSGPISRKSNPNNFYSGPIGGSTTKSGPISGKNKNFNFFSGSLSRVMTKSGPISGSEEIRQKKWQNHGQSPGINGKKPPLKPNRLTQVGPFKGCMLAGNNSPVANCYLSLEVVRSGNLNRAKDVNADLLAPGKNDHSNISIFKSRRKLLDAPPETLGGAALALHYANVIIVIEKLVASPHLIGLDARDDLYNMLPMSVRATLREKLKPFTKSLASSVYDTVLAGEWSEAMAGILEWLAPLAHNMIRWQSERSFEQQSLISRTNVVLVQTLYFANQEKTEATITELLVGLNYVWRFGRELNAKALMECAGSRINGEYLDVDK